MGRSVPFEKALFSGEGVGANGRRLVGRLPDKDVSVLGKGGTDLGELPAQLGRPLRHELRNQKQRQEDKDEKGENGNQCSRRDRFRGLNLSRGGVGS